MVIVAFSFFILVYWCFFVMIGRVLAIAILVSVCGCTTISLFVVNTLAKFEDYRVYNDLSYGEHKLNSLDIYIPIMEKEKNTALRPVVVFFYGGCWGGCETRTKEQYAFVAQALTAHGYIAVLADYRIYPEVRFGQIIHDVAKAVDWVKTNIHQYSGDSDSIFLMGHSAGAHLGAMLSLNEKYLDQQTYKSIKGFVGLSGPYDFLPFTKDYQKEVFGPKDKFPASQPVNFVDGTEPPLLLLYGDKDTIVFPKNIKSLASEVRKIGGHVETKIYKNIDHISILSALSIPLQQKESILRDIIKFLDQQTGKGGENGSGKVNALLKTEN